MVIMGEETEHHHEHGQMPQGVHPSFMRVIQQKQRVKQKLSNIKHKIGVYSAKGGVGKTTIAINLAYALKEKGFKVGLLDADIDCPNVTMFLGMENEKMEPVMPLKPIEKNGVKVASTAMLVDEMKRPIIWRGPIIVKMLGDFFENTEWGALDYLIIDLNPGTSDSPLTIMQVLDLDGFVIVTTPQRIAGINAIRSGMMAKRLGVSVLGVVENMSDGKPSKSTKDIVEALGTKLLGVVKSEPRIAAMSDAGKIHVIEDKAIRAEFDSIIKEL
jgi:ATP-binding protein involved in chromosome partitioning